MKKLVLLALTASGLGFAALPPFYQSIAEIQAILENEEVRSKLDSGAEISSIQHEGDAYTLVAGECALSVEVIYKEMPHPGPAQFDLRVGEAICLP